MTINYANYRSQKQIDAFSYTRERRCNRILEWLRTQPDGATKKRIDRAVGIRTKPLTEAIETLLKNGSIEHCEVESHQNQAYDGYRVTN